MKIKDCLCTKEEAFLVHLLGIRLFSFSLSYEPLSIIEQDVGEIAFEPFRNDIINGNYKLIIHDGLLLHFESKYLIK